MKKTIISILTIAVLGAGLVSTIYPAIVIGHGTFINAGDLADFSYFLEGEDQLAGYYITKPNYVNFCDITGELRSYLKSITLEEDNNKFPFHDYKIDTAYVIYSGNATLMINEEVTKCVVEHHSKDRRNKFTAAKSYNVKEDDVQEFAGVLDEIVGLFE